MAARAKFTKARVEKFLAHLRETANVTESAAACGVSQRMVYTWKKKRVEFSRAWDEAVEVAIDALESEARRRALKGVERKKWTKDGRPLIDPVTGEQYVEREYSDVLLICLLNAHRPEKFRQNHKHTHVVEDIGDEMRKARERAAKRT